MINFRYHLVSLVAVFLALAVGIVVGSTVVDQAIVEGLRDRIDVVERRSESRADENDRLRTEAAEAEEFIRSIAPFAVEHRLTGVPVAIVAVRGVPDEAVEATARLVADARSQDAAIVWLEPAWALDGGDEQRRLANAIDRSGSPVVLRRAGLAALAEALSGAEPEGDDPEGDDAGLLPELVDGGFLTIEPARADARLPERWPGPGARVLVVTGPQARAEIATLPVDLAIALGGAEVPTVLGEIWDESDDGPERGASLAPVLDDDELLARIGTVDHLDRPEGRTVAVLSLAEAGAGVSGHYGYGRGATRSAPAWAP